MPTPNMALEIPIPGVTPGPTYASQISNDLQLVEEHDHSLGRGTPIALIVAGGLQLDGLQHLGIALDGDSLSIGPAGIRVNNLAGAINIVAPVAPNVNGLSLSGADLALALADLTHPGGVSTAAQSFGGAKTFPSGILAHSIISDGGTMIVQGALVAADTGTDIVVESAVTRTNGHLLSVKNNASVVFSISYAGVIDSVQGITNSGDYHQAVGKLYADGMSSQGTVAMDFESNATEAAVTAACIINAVVAFTAKPVLKIQNGAVDIIQVGPTGVASGAAFVNKLINSTPANAGTSTPDASAGGNFLITADVAVASFTVAAPLHAANGEKITIVIRNASGGALTTTWNAIFKMAAWEDPANGFQAGITFMYDGTNWVETHRGASNIPN